MSTLSRMKSQAPLVLGTVALLYLLSNPLGGTTAATLGAHDAQQRLLGTWERDTAIDGRRVHHELSLRPDGSFSEHVRVLDAAGGSAEYRHAGHWLFDGTTLKRNYTLVNGEPPPRLNVPFASFDISFPAPNEFVGVDPTHGYTIDYRRVAPRG